MHRNRNSRGSGASERPRAEQRKYRRFPARQAAKITPFGSGGARECHLVDVSEGGLRLGGVPYLEIGEAIQIEVKDFLWIGEVRHCNAEPMGFVIGVHLRETIKRGDLEILIGHYIDPALELLAE